MQGYEEKVKLESEVRDRWGTLEEMEKGKLKKRTRGKEGHRECRLGFKYMYSSSYLPLIKQYHVLALK